MNCLYHSLQLFLQKARLTLVGLLLIQCIFLGKLTGQLPTHFPPFLPQAGPEEQQASKLIQQICYDFARYKSGDYVLPKGDKIQNIVLTWLLKSGLDYQVEYPKISVRGKRHEAIFSNILPNLWEDLNSDDIPDLIIKTDAWPIREPFAGGTRMNGLYLDRTGILFRSDSIQLPPADSVELSFGFQGSPGSSMTAIIKTPAGSIIQDYTCKDSNQSIHQIRLPLQQLGQAWCSIQLISASSPQARTFLQFLNLSIPETEQFFLTAPDTVRVESFGFLNFRPDIHARVSSSPIQVKILNGPKWLNADEKGYAFGRATCPPDFYPVEMVYSNSDNKSRTIQFVLQVYAAVQIPIPSAETKPDSSILVSSSTPQTLASENKTESKPLTIKGKKKKSNKTNHSIAKAPVLEEKVAPSPIQAYLIRAEGPSQNIRYSVRKDGYVSLTILNQSGDPVKTLFRYQKYMQGLYNIFWDGSNDAGESLSGGEYECRMEFLPADGTPPHSETCRVLKVF